MASSVEWIDIAIITFFIIITCVSLYYGFKEDICSEHFIPEDPINALRQAVEDKNLTEVAKLMNHVSYSDEIRLDVVDGIKDDDNPVKDAVLRGYDGCLPHLNKINKCLLPDHHKCKKE